MIQRILTFCLLVIYYECDAEQLTSLQQVTNKVHIGMSASQVFGILGKPGRERTSADGLTKSLEYDNNINRIEDLPDDGFTGYSVIIRNSKVERINGAYMVKSKTSVKNNANTPARDYGSLSKITNPVIYLQIVKAVDKAPLVLDKTILSEARTNADVLVIKEIQSAWIGNIQSRNNTGQTPETMLVVQLNKRQASQLEMLTGANIGYNMGLFINDQFIMAPVISGAVPNGRLGIHSADTNLLYAVHKLITTHMIKTTNGNRGAAKPD